MMLIIPPTLSKSHMQHAADLANDALFPGPGHPDDNVGLCEAAVSVVLLIVGTPCFSYLFVTQSEPHDFDFANVTTCSAEANSESRMS